MGTQGDRHYSTYHSVGRGRKAYAWLIERTNSFTIVSTVSEIIDSMISSAALAFFYLSGLYKGKFGVRVTAIYSYHVFIFLYDYIGFCFHLSPWFLLMLLGDVVSSGCKHFRYFGRGIFFICSLFDYLEVTFMV